jgi:hypothetical protein
MAIDRGEDHSGLGTPSEFATKSRNSSPRTCPPLGKLTKPVQYFGFYGPERVMTGRFGDLL